MAECVPTDSLRSEAIIVATVSSKEFLGTLRTALTSGKPVKIVGPVALRRLGASKSLRPAPSRKLVVQRSLRSPRLTNRQQTSATFAFVLLPVFARNCCVAGQ
jgi:hypothetical protein